MNRKMVKTIALGTFTLVVVLGAWWQARAQDAKAPYPSMAPLDHYLMTDRNAEIALAHSAAPASISSDTEVLALGRHGYETAIEGKRVIKKCTRDWPSRSSSLFFCYRREKETSRSNI